MNLLFVGFSVNNFDSETNSRDEQGVHSTQFWLKIKKNKLENAFLFSPFDYTRVSVYVSLYIFLSLSQHTHTHSACSV